MKIFPSSLKVLKVNLEWCVNRVLYPLAKLQGKCTDTVNVYILLFAFVEYSVYNTTRVKFTYPAYIIRENKTQPSISQHRINSTYQDTTVLQPSAVLNGIYQLLVIIRKGRPPPFTKYFRGQLLSLWWTTLSYLEIQYVSLFPCRQCIRCTALFWRHGTREATKAAHSTDGFRTDIPMRNIAAKKRYVYQRPHRNTLCSSARSVWSESLGYLDQEIYLLHHKTKVQQHVYAPAYMIRL